MPWHPPSLQNRHSVIRILVNLLEVQNTCIVIVLSGEQSGCPVGRVDV